MFSCPGVQSNCFCNSFSWSLAASEVSDNLSCQPVLVKRRAKIQGILVKKRVFQEIGAKWSKFSKFRAKRALSCQKRNGPKMAPHSTFSRKKWNGVPVLAAKNSTLLPKMELLFILATEKNTPWKKVTVWLPNIH